VTANIAANYLGKAWSFLSIYAFAPLYVHILGISAYGLIAFYSVLLAILAVADVGLSATFARQAAREADAGSLLTQLRSVEVVLVSSLVAVAAVIFFLAPVIASQWLRGDNGISQDLVVNSLRLMPLALVPQVAMSLYLGGLMGRQRQVAANLWQSTFVGARSAGVLIPLAFAPDLMVFFSWYAVCGWVFFFLIRRALLSEIGRVDGRCIGHFSPKVLMGLRGYALGMFAMSIIAGLNGQVDRLVVSRMRSLDEFAWYSLAATLAQIPTMAAMPVAAALLPRLTQLVESGGTAELTRLYLNGTYALAVIGSVMAGTVGFFAAPMLSLWMPGQVFPHLLPSIVAILCAGGLFLALQLMPFQLSLAHGHSATNVRLGIAVLCVSIPLQLLFTSQYGLLGAALPWLLVGLVGFIAMGFLLNRRFGLVDAKTWFLRLNFMPAVVCLLVIALARLATLALDLTPVWCCVVAAISAAFLLGAGYVGRQLLVGRDIA
jgi:O-antigen/teichoic acid export membrane protein